VRSITYILCLVLACSSCQCDVEVSSTPIEARFEDGDMVQVRLTGETGVVLDSWFSGSEFEVRMPDYEVRRFKRFELTLLEEQDRVDTSGEKVSPPAEKSASETPNTIFDNEKVWNPQTQKYETTRAN